MFLLWHKLESLKLHLRYKCCTYICVALGENKKKKKLTFKVKVRLHQGRSLQVYVEKQPFAPTSSPTNNRESMKTAHTETTKYRSCNLDRKFTNPTNTL